MAILCTKSFDEAVQGFSLGKFVVILQQSNQKTLFRLYQIFLCHRKGIFFLGRHNIPLNAYGYIIYCSKTQPMSLLIGWTHQWDLPKRKFWQYPLKPGDIIFILNSPLIFHNAFCFIPEGLAIQNLRCSRSQERGN